MSAPLPASALDGHCSAIHNDILYVLSSNSFQSLPLQKNATWSSLSMGEAVTGPACIRAVPNGDESQAALYVIGGSSQDSSYSGLQRFTFSSKKWETIMPTTKDMQGRTDHSAAYLNDSSSILVYAGSQPSAYSDLSSQTFVISTSSPYNIRSFTSTAPPSKAPVLLPWASNSAIMAGGSDSNKEVWTFDPNSGGWSQFDTSLTDSIGSGVRATIIAGSDGSKVLETYDISVSPNKVSQIVLLDAGGKTAATGQTIGSSRKRKRDLTLSDWPSYNSTGAPSVTRSDYAIAQDANGLAVISGGNQGAPVNIFNEQKNAWVDNGAFFSDEANGNQVPIVTPNPSSTSNPSTTSATVSPTATTGTVLDNNSARHHMLKVLGITLGVLCGIAALFIIALLLLRWRKQKKRRQSQYVDEKADRMSFQDRGASFMKEAGGSHMDLSRVPPNHRFMEQNSSHNSYNIVAGKFGKGSANVGGRKGDGRGSTESTRQLVKPRKADISRPVELDLWGHEKEVVTEQSAPREAGPSDKKRSSGWSRYFTSGEAQLPSAYDRNQNGTGNTPGDATDTRPGLPHRIPSDVLVPPLDFGRNEDGQRFAAVARGSPSFNNSAEDLARRGSSIDAARGQRAHIQHSGLSAAYNDDDDDDQTNSTRTYSTTSDIRSSSGFFDHSSANSPWTPVSTYHNGQPEPKIVGGSSSPNPNHVPRAPSSNYTASVYDNLRVPSRGNGSGFFLGGNRDVRPPSRSKGLEPPNVGFPPHGKGAMDAPNREEENRDSTMTVFPRGVPSAYYANKKQSDGLPASKLGTTSDMSWLRLDTGERI